MEGQSIDVNFLSYFKNITTFIFDMDGVLTDGQMHVTEKGEVLRTLNAKDGYALHRAVEQGYKVALLSRGESAGYRDLLLKVGFSDIFMLVYNKLEVYEQFKATNNLIDGEILYMGDDVPDLPVLKKVGISACPADAVHEVREKVKYISIKNGGDACVRDVIEKTLRIQRKWIS